MGAQGYGQIDEEFVERNHNIEVYTNPLMLLDQVLWRGKPPVEHPNFFVFESDSFKDWLASVHHLLGMLYWRPYASSILLSKVSEIFECTSPSPYMLRTLMVREHPRDFVPAVVHVDGTSRGQTVDGNDPELKSYLTLLQIVSEMIGFPGVLNTSMNAAGSPITSTPEQALQLWKDTPLDVLCIGNQLWEK